MMKKVAFYLWPLFSFNLKPNAYNNSYYSLSLASPTVLSSTCSPRLNVTVTALTTASVVTEYLPTHQLCESNNASSANHQPPA